MRRQQIMDLLVVVVIVGLGLLTAWVTFGILDSSATLETQEYALGGAIAGAVVSWAVLGSLYFQIRKASGELQDLRETNTELNKKLLRGAPRPQDWVTEVADRVRLVLARPEKWRPRGGVVFDFDQPDPAPEEMTIETLDLFPRRFQLSYHRHWDQTSADEFYSDYLKSVEQAATDGVMDLYSWEFTQIGSDNPEDARGIRSLKTTGRSCFEVRLSRSPLGAIERELTNVQPDRLSFVDDVLEAPDGEPNPDLIAELAARHDLSLASERSPMSNEDCPPEVAARREYELVREHYAKPGGPGVKAFIEAKSDEVATVMRAWRVNVVCFHEALGTVYLFDFWDDSEHFEDASLEFNQLLRTVRFLT